MSDLFTLRHVSLYVRDADASASFYATVLGLQERESLADGSLVRLLDGWAAAPRPLYLVYPPNRHVSVRLRAFIDWAAALFARGSLG